jgi:NAD-dependent dihydropyrimidine dehydrogenase PreA subunit
LIPEKGETMITIKHDGCILCVGCSSVCPVNAIEVVGTRMEHFPSRCIDCGICVRACPANVIRLYKGVKEPKDLPEKV